MTLAGLNAIGVGITAACATFIVGLLTESVKRHNDRRGLAASLSIEVITMSATFSGLDYGADMIKALEGLLKKDQWEKGFGIDFPLVYTPVFDKSIEKIGIFRTQLAQDVLMFYFCMKGHSQMFTLACSKDDIPLEARKVIVRQLIDRFPLTFKMQYPLIIELGKVANRKWGPLGVFYRYK